jgi:hypothetical protein
MEGFKMKTSAITERKKTKSFDVLTAVVSSVDVALILTAMTLLTMTFIRTFSTEHQSESEKISALGKNSSTVVLREVDFSRSVGHAYHFN